jgi:hypothetical protein
MDPDRKRGIFRLADRFIDQVARAATIRTPSEQRGLALGPSRTI